MANMVDVAKMADVSISTVSHVLNGTRHVQPETRQRVIDAIERTGYRQDALARALRRARTDSIGLVVSDAGEPAFAEMVHGVESAAVEHGLTLLLANSAEDADREERAVETLLDRRVDGLILARAAGSEPAILQSLGDEKTPVVLLDRLYSELPFDQVGADNRDSMRRLTDHLVAAGHRRFVVVSGDARVPTLQERVDGFRDALWAARVPYEEQVVIDDVDPAVARAQLASALESGGITCVIACSTPLAAMALETLGRAGLTTPRDVAFATFDGFAHPDLFEPRITTVRQPAFDMGVAAVRLLVERMASAESSPRIVRLRQTLELRGSTEDHDLRQVRP